MTPPKLIVDVDNFRRRILEDCLTAALPDSWSRRAADLEAAAPRAGDYVGQASPEELAERRRRCLTDAAACREHAAILNGYPRQHFPEVDDVLGEDVSWT